MFPAAFIRYSLRSILILFVGLLMAACASAPTPVEVPPTEAEGPEAAAPERFTAELAADPEIIRHLDPDRAFQLGVEVEAESAWPHLRDKRLTLVTDNYAVDTRGVHVIERLAEALQTSLTDVALLLKEGEGRSEAVRSALARHPRIRVHQIPADSPSLPLAAFRNNDAIVFDMALPGTRYAPELRLLADAQEKASLNYKDFVVLDRPPALSATLASGPPPQARYLATENAIYPIGLLPGMTTGEMAKLLNGRFGLQADLYVVPMKHWKRGDGNRWVQEPLWELSERGRDHIEALQRSSLYRTGHMELQVALELARASDWTKAEFLDKGGNPATLVLEPANLAGVTILERLTTLFPEGLDARPIDMNGESADRHTIAISPADGASIDPVRLSFALRMAAATDPLEYTPEEGPSPYGRDDIWEGFRAGFLPHQFERSWLTLQPWRDFVQEREEVLLYEP